MAQCINYDLNLCTPDPHDPESIRRAIHNVNRAIEHIYHVMVGQPIINDDVAIVRNDDHDPIRVPEPVFEAVAIQPPGPQGATGPPGPPAPAGTIGPPGPAGLGHYGKLQTAVYEGGAYYYTTIRQCTVDGDNVYGDTFVLYIAKEPTGTVPNLSIGDVITYMIDNKGSAILIGGALSNHVHSPTETFQAADTVGGAVYPGTVGKTDYDNDVEDRTHWHQFPVDYGECWKAEGNKSTVPEAP